MNTVTGKRKREDNVYSIFIDFDETLSDNHIDEDEKINTENFISLCYNDSKEKYDKIQNTLNRLYNNYNFYVLSRNENESLKEVIHKMFPNVFKEILLYSDLKKFFQENLPLFSKLKSEYTEGKRSPDEVKKFAVIKRELALSKACNDNIILIDDNYTNISLFISVGPIALKFSHHYNKDKKYLDEVLNDIHSNIITYNESWSKHESKNNEETTSTKNVDSLSSDSPDVKRGNLFGLDSDDSGKKNKKKLKSKRKSIRKKSKSKRKSIRKKSKSKRKSRK